MHQMLILPCPQTRHLNAPTPRCAIDRSFPSYGCQVPRAAPLCDRAAVLSLVTHFVNSRAHGTLSRTNLRYLDARSCKASGQSGRSTRLSGCEVTDCCLRQPRVFPLDHSYPDCKYRARRNHVYSSGRAEPRTRPTPYSTRLHDTPPSGATWVFMRMCISLRKPHKPKTQLEDFLALLSSITTMMAHAASAPSWATRP
jgi:hypothetical protein